MIDVTIKLLYKYQSTKYAAAILKNGSHCFIVIKLCLPSSNESENYRLQGGINVWFIDRVVAETFSNMEVCSPDKIIRS